MSLLLLSLALVQPAPVVAADQTDEIVVIARKLHGVRWDWRVNKTGELAMCKITRSSGDSEIDAIGCDATRLCAKQGARTGAAMKACILPVRQDLITQLAGKRAARDN